MSLLPIATKIAEAIDAIDALAEVKCPMETYLEALHDVQSHLEISIEAAEEDIRRAKKEAGDE
jgi:hypothetical protein